MRTLFCALLLAVTACRVQATTVLCAGDSLTRGDVTAPATSYPSQLQALRPDLTIVNGGKMGDVTWNLDRYQALLVTWQPDIVVLLYGVNETFRPVVEGIPPPPADRLPTPAQSVRNLRMMARLAHAQGARVVLLVPPPTLCLPDAHCSDTDREAAVLRTAHTRTMMHLLYGVHLPRWLVLGDFRDAIAVDWRTLSDDGVHPNVAGYARLAAFVASLL